MTFRSHEHTHAEDEDREVFSGVYDFSANPASMRTDISHWSMSSSDG
jgi:hypothetical protein